MKNFKYFALSLLGAISLGLGMSSCQDSFDVPGITDAPVATLKPNMTILELKEMFWDDATNYIKAIGGTWYTADGQEITFDGDVDLSGMYFKPDDRDYIIKGVVISSDEAGNVFKNLVIQDSTAAVTLSINSYNLYLKYRIGQEIVINLKGMFIGKYNGLQQLGYPEWYANGSAWEATFMAPVFFERNAELNGWPEAAKVDTIQVNSFAELSTSDAGLRRWQSQIVRFNNVTFANGGVETFSTYKNTENQTIYDAEGNSLIVRTSGYSNFWNKTLPSGYGDLVAILSYYGSTGWQLILNDAEGCMNFGNPTTSGTEENPYTVEEVIAIESSGRTTSGWVTGYIVGAVAPEVTTVASNDDVEWKAPTTLNNTLVIGMTADTKSIDKCLVVSLPAESSLRRYGNLRQNPDNLGKQIWIKGTYASYMGTYGITENSGKAATFRIEGVEVPDDSQSEGEVAKGDGSKAAPYNVGQVIAMNPTSTTDAVATGAWVSGYIVGYMPTTGSTVLSNTTFSADGAVATNLVLGPSPSCTNPDECIAIQLPYGDVRSALNLMDHPSNLKALVNLKGDVMKYCGGPGLKNTSEYEIKGVENPGPGENPNPGQASGSGTESDPYNVAKVIALNPTSTTDAVATDVWVDGYIVGYMPNTGSTVLSNTTFSADGAVATNLVLGPTASCKNTDECIAIQLPYGDVRTALNLMDNPGNLGKNVKLKGDVMKYCGGPGLKNTSEYKIDGSGNNPGGGEQPNPGQGTGSGTQSDPYNVAKALEIIASGSYTSNKVYIKGIISTVKEINTQYGNSTYFISDDGSNSNELEVFRGYYLGGEKFTAGDQIKAGDKVLILGALTLYGSTPEVTTGSQIVSLNDGNGSGNTGNDNPSTGGDNPNPTGEGSEASPYNCAKIIQLNPQSTNEAVATAVWVEGYIVGFMPTSGSTVLSNTVFSAQEAVATNLVLAPTADCKDYNVCIPVQLPTGTIRSDLNLKDNPSNLGKHVKLQGDVMKYCGSPGLKNTSAYKWL